MNPPPITFDDLRELEDNLEKVLDHVALINHAAAGKKVAPRYNPTLLARLCRKSPSTMARLLSRAEEFKLPKGDVEGGNRRYFSHGDARKWIREFGAYYRRPLGVPGCVIATGNFKGGVGKTMISLTVAQALSLMGYRVLCIDLDPQGSLTSLLDMGRDVPMELTALPLLMNPTDPAYRDSLIESISDTYWDGIDLVAASTALFNGEFFLPLRQIHEEGFRFMEVFDRCLSRGIRDEYDYIIIDTPPALSYVTMSGYWAADAILMPIPAEGIDIASSTEFWTLFTNLGEIADETASMRKTFAWIAMVPSKIDNSKAYTAINMAVMKQAYGKYLMDIEIPLSSAVGTGGVSMSTIYDMERYAGSKKTYDKARTAFDRLADEVDLLTRTCKWQQSPGDIELDRANPTTQG